MDVRRFSSDVRNVVKEVSHLRRKKNGRAYNYDLAILFARIWFFKAEIFAHRETNPLRLGTSVEDFIDGLYEGSTFLVKSFTSHPQDKTDKQALKLIEEIPGYVEALYDHPSESDEEEGSIVLRNGNRTRDLLGKFLVQLKLFKADVLLLGELLNKDELSNWKKQIGTLREGLIFLIKSDVHQPKQEEDTEDEKLILADIEELAAGIICLCNSSCSPENMEFQLADLLGKVQNLKAKLKDLYFQMPPFNCPKTPGLGSIRSFLHDLKELSSGAPESVECATYQIEAIHGDLELIIHKYGHFLDEDIVKNQKSIDEIRTRLVDAAHHVENVIDLMKSSNDPNSQLLMWLYHFSEEITDVKVQLVDYCDNTTILGVGVETYSYRYHHLALPMNTVPMVGFNEEQATLIERLTRGTSRLKAVSITGMPGIGKTTLAENVYNSHDVVNHFHVRVWCCVSPAYEKRDLLLELIKGLTEVRPDMLTRKEEELCSVLYIYLKSRRYLIVMDDVWSSAAWDDLKSSFPDGSYGSRVLMTSRIYNVVPNPLPLRGLSIDESWELLQMLVFGDEGSPPELCEVGRRIAENCKGLPVAVVSVASLLVSQPEAQWVEVAERAGSQIVNAQVTEFIRMFEESYKKLPDHLKQCFLYFGVCPRDEDISVRRLLWLWIAEGFIIPNVENKSLEDLAEEYLMDLIQRRLVILSKQRSNGEVKTCRVHNQILDFCLLKAKEAKFLQLISGESSYGSPNHLHDEHRNPSNLIDSGHRLSICGDPEEFIAKTPSVPYLRSLQFFDTSEMYPGCDSDVSFIFDNFKLLKVLDLESINIGNSLHGGINLPLPLRYLAIGGDMDCIPSSLSKLQNLETLVVKGLMNKFVLPDTIWSMTKLRHVHVTNHCIFTLQCDKNGSLLKSLVSLSMPSFVCGDETNDTVRRFPNLRKLKCIFLQPRGRSMHVCRFPDLEHLYLLNTLEITYYGRPLKTGEFIFPSTLRKLTLSNFRLPWNCISVISSLPYLEVLKLISRAFVGSSWLMEDGVFPNLRYLKLDSLDIAIWDFSLWDDPFPCLEQLLLRNCGQLKEVPSIFGEIITLQRIEVHQCGDSTKQSVRRIVEEQREFGNYDLISVFS
ncbi:OLC1v1031979C1 [Oldenlandia corymbosa var. corymbosa]|uniref:OLC1v1031979C1 n=1 Tax=Oldenlandia corymbosa var. corymbosa TaxID=529605 RepID=A0AAV1CJW0_OLDCO|nr:OLC1v1031979C1 [Oldenlandia corymbosa var. corymbosa]